MWGSQYYIHVNTFESVQMLLRHKYLNQKAGKSLKIVGLSDLRKMVSLKLCVLDLT